MIERIERNVVSYVLSPEALQLAAKAAVIELFGHVLNDDTIVEIVGDTAIVRTTLPQPSSERKAG